MCDEYDDGYDDGYESGYEAAKDEYADIMKALLALKKEASVGDWEYVILPKLKAFIDE